MPVKPGKNRRGPTAADASVGGEESKERRRKKEERGERMSVIIQLPLKNHIHNLFILFLIFIFFFSTLSW